jgi:hypothetical protein
MTRSRAFWASLVAWVLAGWLLAFFDRLIWDALWIGAVYLWGFYVVTGLLLLIVSCFLGWGAARSWHALSTPAVALVGVALVWMAESPLRRVGGEAVFHWRFSRARPTYDMIVAETLRQPPPDTSHVPWVNLDHGDVEYSVDLGPPVRIAFVQPGGIIDNWEGIVYDRSGAVRAATGWKNAAGQFSAPPELVWLFGGDLLECRPVVDHYYRCWFT